MTASEIDRAISALRDMPTARLGEAAFARVAEAARLQTKRAVLKHRLVWVGAGLALAAAIAFAILLPANLMERRTTSDRVLRLASGSTVLLSPGTEASTRRDPDGEMVRLRRGLAFFRVRPVGSGRTFVVESQLVSATVLGTAFWVEAREGEARVDVVEGRVQVRSRAGEVRLLVAGQSASIGGDGRFVLQTAAAPADSAEQGPSPVARLEPGDERSESKRAQADSLGRSEWGVRGGQWPTRWNGELAPEAPEAEQAPIAAKKRFGPAPTSQELIAKARIHLRERRYEQAEHVAAAAGESVEALFVRADALRGAGQTAEAAAIYRRIADGSGRAAENALYALAMLELDRRGAPGRAAIVASEYLRRFRGGALEQEMAQTRYEALLRAGRAAEARTARDELVKRFSPDAGGGLPEQEKGR